MGPVALPQNVIFSSSVKWETVCNKKAGFYYIFPGASYFSALVYELLT